MSRVTTAVLPPPPSHSILGKLLTEHVLRWVSGSTSDQSPPSSISYPVRSPHERRREWTTSACAPDSFTSGSTSPMSIVNSSSRSATSRSYEQGASADEHARNGRYGCSRVGTPDSDQGPGRCWNHRVRSVSYGRFGRSEVRSGSARLRNRPTLPTRPNGESSGPGLATHRCQAKDVPVKFPYY